MMNKEDKAKRILTTTGYTTELEKSIVLSCIEELQQKVNQLKENNFKLQARSDRYKQRIIELKKTLEHYKAKEIERLTENLLQARNDCLEGYIKANMCGDING